MSKNYPAKARNLLTLTKQEKLQFLQSFDVVLSDCDGVIWMLVEPIPNTGPAIMALKQAGKHFKYISNNSMRTDAEYLGKLASIGVKGTQASDLVHPVKTISRYISRNMPGQPVFSLCCSVMNESLRQHGVNVKTMKPSIDLATQELTDYIVPSDSVAAVILDLNFNLTFSELARAQQYLKNEQCQLIVGASDALVPITKDFITIGSAGFKNILEQSTGKQSVLLGKPSTLLGADLQALFNIKNAKRALFIGDNLTMDIGFGNECGFQTLFVLSGANTFEQMSALPDERKPDYYANGLADFSEFFENLFEMHLEKEASFSNSCEQPMKIQNGQYLNQPAI